MRRTQRGATAVFVILGLAVSACQEPIASAGQTDQRVEGVGTLVRDADGSVRLCAMVVVPGVAGPPQVGSCYPPAVPVASAPESAFTVTGEGRRARGDTVRVEGVYRSGTVILDKVEPSDLPPGTEPATPAVPCDAPSGGWRTRSVYTDPADFMRARSRLAQVVDADPATYAGRWMGYPGERRTEAGVQVVGTVGDVEEARRAFSAIYRDNLCVYRAGFSTAELERRAAALTAGGMWVHADPMTNRVRVRPVILDAPTDRLLDKVRRDALAIEEPLLSFRS